MDVVVVESPAKAKTINKYLGDNYIVLASYGHVRDLPAKNGSVRPDENFAMTYVTDPKAAKHVSAIAKALKGADNLYLATDPDREGEAIAWHVLAVLEEKGVSKGITVSRIAFNEITKSAVNDAIVNPRQLDMNLINAQQARRALDYLVGFTLSPVLWRKLPGSRSAGRVQSVALRMICERETEIEAFRPREYWSIEAEFTTVAGDKLTTRLTDLEGRKLDKFGLADEAAASHAVSVIQSAADYKVALVETKERPRHPYPPFTTSTLQQEASRKLRMSARQTMQTAQRLYEGIDIGGETVGLITYMRTDGVQIANEAIAACRAVIAEDFGQAYVPDSPRAYKTKAKNAQEAHEAIRPTSLQRRPKELAHILHGDQLKLYELIWKRTMASQMASARLQQAAIDVDAGGRATLRATGSIVIFDGFLKLYEEGKDDQDENGAGGRLPQVAEGEQLSDGPVKPKQHFTEPLPRYSEATLVKGMEELGIGRPSTYASILSVLQDRDYVRLEKNRFIPEDRGRLVTAFLSSFFPQYVEYDFTADLEAKLDAVSAGEIDWKALLAEFWTSFNAAVAETADLRVREVLDALDEILGAHFFQSDDPNVNPRDCPSCEDGRLGLKLGKFGAFIGCSNYPECKQTQQLTDGGQDTGPRELGVDPANDDKLVSVRKGPYGYYVQLGDVTEDEPKPKRVSLVKDLPPDDVDLEMALGLLSLPRDIGLHPETNKKIIAGLGRFGPYLRHDTKYTSLKGDDDVLEIGLNRAVVLIAEAAARGGRGSSATVLKELGKHPDDDAVVNVLDGRYGPYVKHGKINATLPKGVNPGQMTLERALELIAEKAAKKKATAKKKAPAKKASPATADAE
jgi:DNA topoisomerase-1